MKILGVAAGLLLQAMLASWPAPSPVPTENPECVKYFKSACSEAIGAWLPTFGFPSDDTSKDTRVTARDGFVYENEKPSAPEYLGYQGPYNGTFFVHGNSGPPKGRLVYDYVHHIAFYQQGCCSWNEVVAAAHVAPPPKQVVSHDLTTLHTVRGIHLGMRSADVMRIYGSATLLPLSLHPGVKELAYTTWLPQKPGNPVTLPCGQDESFFFRHDTLILIRLGNGC
jgi:hypothetical protein